jgi:VanZ family protein
MTSAVPPPYLWLRRVLALAYLAGVFWLGTIDIGPLPLERLPTDKIGHIGAFGGMVVIVELALLELGTSRRRGWAFLASVATGGLLELVQAALPHRSADVGDWVADCIGAVLAVGLSFAVARLFSARPSPGDAAPGV